MSRTPGAVWAEHHSEIPAVGTEGLTPHGVTGAGAGACPEASLPAHLWAVRTHVHALWLRGTYLSDLHLQKTFSS